MVSVMVIEGEVTGSCVEEIDVSVEIKNEVVWLCCGLIYLGFVLAGKAAKDWCRRVVMVPGIGGSFYALGVIEELKSPYGGMGFC